MPRLKSAQASVNELMGTGCCGTRFHEAGRWSCLWLAILVREPADCLVGADSDAQVALVVAARSWWWVGEPAGPCSVR